MNFFLAIKFLIFRSMKCTVYECLVVLVAVFCFVFPKYCNINNYYLISSSPGCFYGFVTRKVLTFRNRASYI
jgi:hypothetical protein